MQAGRSRVVRGWSRPVNAVPAAAFDGAAQKKAPVGQPGTDGAAAITLLLQPAAVRLDGAKETASCGGEAVSRSCPQGHGSTVKPAPCPC
jgi:hypothetical protein